MLCRSQWQRGLRGRSTAARLLRLWVRIPPGHVCLSVVTFVYFQVEISATSWSLVQGVLQTVVRRCVWSRNLVNEEAMAHWGCYVKKVMHCCRSLVLNRKNSGVVSSRRWFGISWQHYPEAWSSKSFRNVCTHQSYYKTLKCMHLCRVLII
jgi:hypothetical protein